MKTVICDLKKLSNMWFIAVIHFKVSVPMLNPDGKMQFVNKS